MKGWLAACGDAGRTPFQLPWALHARGAFILVAGTLGHNLSPAQRHEQLVEVAGRKTRHGLYAYADGRFAVSRQKSGAEQHVPDDEVGAVVAVGLFDRGRVVPAV